MPLYFDVESVRIQEGGELPKGLYVYALVGVDKKGNKTSPHIIQVNAPYRDNIISLFWEPDPDIDHYRIYRGNDFNCFYGYFILPNDSQICYFHDAGFWEYAKTGIFYL